jgi:ribosome-associated protein
MDRLVHSDLGTGQDVEEGAAAQGLAAQVDALDHPASLWRTAGDNAVVSNSASTSGSDSGAVPEVPIRDDVIRLGQFLKLADLAEHGAQARDLIADGEVRVNGEVETRRGRQLVRGDVVAVSVPSGEESAKVG